MQATLPVTALVGQKQVQCLLGLLLSILLCLSCTFYAGTARAQGAQEVLSALQTAIDTKNYDLMERHLDTDAILEDFFVNGLPHLNNAVAAGKIVLTHPVSMALGAIEGDGGVLQSAAVYFIGNETKKFLRFGIESGSFAGHPARLEDLATYDSGMFADVRMAPYYRCRFRDSRVKQNGSKAVATTSFQLVNLYTILPLELALTQKDGVWRVTAIKNSVELLDTLLGIGS